MNTRAPSDADLDRLVAAKEGSPREYLGCQSEPRGYVLRAFRPGARQLYVRWRDAEPAEMDLVHAAGVFEWLAPHAAQPDDYRYCSSRDERGLPDPYVFPPLLGELDLHLLGEGRHQELHHVLGAHCRSLAGVGGVSFIVWAPHARRVSVVGEFNGWDGRRHLMNRRSGGYWELFLPRDLEGAIYKYELLTSSGAISLKSDPCGRHMELRPGDASIVFRSRFDFSDEAWMKARAGWNVECAPMSIYELHLGSWRQAPVGTSDGHGPDPSHVTEHPPWLGYRESADQLAHYLNELGFTHVEIMPVAEHPLDASWGYQVGGYFAPTSRYGTPDDFRYFVDRMHRAGIGVILDWVPAHFPKDAFALGRFDGTALYEHLDPRQGEHRQWGTYVFNYGRPEVRNFLVANALYWIEEFHIDGLRADAVASMLYLDYAAREAAEWIPNEFGGRENLEAVTFLRELTRTVHESHPGVVLIAEESTAWPGVTQAVDTGGLGFDLKWNMGWMHDTLAYFKFDPLFRKHHHERLTFGLMYAFSERFMLPLSHDEVVHLKGPLIEKMSGDRWQKFANLRSLYAYMWAHPGKKLLFMGGEFAQPREWAEDRSLDWHVMSDRLCKGLHQLLGDLNRSYRKTGALHQRDSDPRGFRWLEANECDLSVLSFLRFALPEQQEGQPHRVQHVVTVANFTPVVRRGYRVGVPSAGVYREVINTDAPEYGGSGVGNLGSVVAEAIGANDQPYSIVLTLPPLGVLWLAPDSSTVVP